MLPQRVLRDEVLPTFDAGVGLNPRVQQHPVSVQLTLSFECLVAMATRNLFDTGLPGLVAVHVTVPIAQRGLTLWLSLWTLGPQRQGHFELSVDHFQVSLQVLLAAVGQLALRAADGRIPIHPLDRLGHLFPLDADLVRLPHVGSRLNVAGF